MWLVAQHTCSTEKIVLSFCLVLIYKQNKTKKRFKWESASSVHFKDLAQRAGHVCDQHFTIHFRLHKHPWSSNSVHFFYFVDSRWLNKRLYLSMAPCCCIWRWHWQTTTNLKVKRGIYIRPSTLRDCTVWYSSFVFSQKKLQEASLKSVQKLKDYTICTIYIT